jgi:hypothetical protein
MSDHYITGPGVTPLLPEDSSKGAPVTTDVPSRLTFDGPKAPLFKALAEARKHFGQLTTDAKADVSSKEGKFLYSFKYAPLNVVLAALEPGLTAAGLALMQPFDGDTMYTIVAFEGSSLTVETSLPEWSTPQQLGSLLTYIRRYQIKGLFAVADEEDDDGNEASGNKAQVTRKEPSAPKSAPSTDLSKATQEEVISLAKAKGLDGAALAKLVYEQTGQKWKDCSELDAKKVLAALVLIGGDK